MTTTKQHDPVQLIRYSDVAERLAMSLPQFRRLVDSGRIRRFRFGRRCVRVNLADVERYAMSERR